MTLVKCPLHPIDTKKDGTPDEADDNEQQKAKANASKKQIDLLKNDLDSLTKKKTARELDLKKAILELGSKKDQLKNAEVFYNFIQ